MGEPIFYKAERFFPDKKYEEFSKIFNKAELVTYDVCLCGVIHDENLLEEIELAGRYVRGVKTKSWQSLLKTPLSVGEQIIAYYKNPIESYEHHKMESDFEFCGYDLSEEMTGISALTNCGELFSGAIPYEELNKFGLISEYCEAFRIRKLLENLYPDEPHAECEVYELWRRL